MPELESLGWLSNSEVVFALIAVGAVHAHGGDSVPGRVDRRNRGRGAVGRRGGSRCSACRSAG